MTESELNTKFINYGKKFPYEKCVFHTELATILDLPYYLKKVIDIYIDEAESNPRIAYINSLMVEPRGPELQAIFFSYVPNSLS